MVAFIVLLQLQSFLLLDSIVDFREEEGFFLPCESGFDLALVHFFSVSLLVDKGLVPFNVDVRNCLIHGWYGSAVINGSDEMFMDLLLNIAYK
jgi:hypothetical protein